METTNKTILKVGLIFSVSAAGMWWPRGRPTCRAGPLGMLRFYVARGKAVNREDKRSRRYRDRDFAKFERSRRYRDR
jgi:hypothetical protein